MRIAVSVDENEPPPTSRTHRSWPVYRQLTGTDRLGLGRAAQSSWQLSLTARTHDADRTARSVCQYCAVGCGQHVHVKHERVIQIEGTVTVPSRVADCVRRGRPKANGAPMIHIDGPARCSDLHVPLRAGSDIAFPGGVINYMLSNELDFHEYVVTYTNAVFLVSEDYQDTEDLDDLPGRHRRR